MSVGINGYFIYAQENVGSMTFQEIVCQFQKVEYKKSLAGIHVIFYLHAFWEQESRY